MIDLHTHILPGIDDGVNDMEECVEFGRMAERDGVKTIVATPHYREGFYVNERPGIMELVEKVRERFEAEGVGIDLLPGAEVHLCPDLVERISDGRATTLNNNGKTLLLELSLSQYPVDLENVIFQLKLAGIIPLFAHPERIRYFQDDPKRYEEVVRLGSWGQITTGSILGTFGREAAEYSRELLEKGLVHVIASDAHNVRGRPPLMREAVLTAAEIVGEEYAEAMVSSAPRAFVEGNEPELPELKRARSKPSLFSRLFGRG